MAAISVVIPTFDRCHRVVRAVRSVLCQEETDFEVLIIDDGSTDGTAAAIAQLEDARVSYVFQDNAGRSAARNLGIDRARAKVIVFLDSDDEARPDWLRLLLAAFDQDTGVVSCAAAMVREGSPADSAHRVMRPHVRGPVYYGFSGLFLAGTFAVRTDVARRAGGYEVGLDHAENTDFALRFLRVLHERGLEARVVDKVLVNYRTAPTPRRDPAKVLAAMEHLLSAHGARYQRLAPDGYARICAIAGVNASRVRRRSDAVRFFLRAGHQAPLQMKHWMRAGIALLPPIADRLWDDD